MTLKYKNCSANLYVVGLKPVIKYGVQQNFQSIEFQKVYYPNNVSHQKAFFKKTFFLRKNELSNAIPTKYIIEEEEAMLKARVGTIE